MNRYFEFSSAQLKTVLALTVLLVILGGYHVITTFAVAGETSPVLTIQAADPDLGYAPILIVDINHSPADSLELLPGIGPVLAMRIVTYRDSVQGFTKAEELTKVAGIGQATYRMIEPYLEVKPW